MLSFRLKSLSICLGVLCVGAAALCAQTPASESDARSGSGGLRTWTDASGTRKVEASLIDSADGKLRLKRADGKVVEVPLDRLSEADRAWLAKQAVADVPNHAAGSWPGWLGPNRDGHSPDIGLLKQWPEGGPKLLWKAETIGSGWSSVAVVDSRVYTTGYSDGKQMLICLDMNGKIAWRAEHRITDNHPNYKGARSTPAVDGDRIYFVGNDGLVACHQAANGQIVWKREMVAELGGKHGNWYYAESVLVLDNLVIVTPGGPSGIVALDKATGEDVWKSNVPLTAGYSSCIPIRAAGSTIVVNGSENGLLAVDAKTGRKVWEHDIASGGSQNIATPAYEDGFLAWLPRAKGGGIGFKVDFKDGRWHFDEVWRSGAIDNKPGNYVAAQGWIFGNGRGSLTCVDLKTGKTLWSLRDVEAGQCCWADGMVYALSSKEGMACLVEPSATGGKVTGRVQVAGRGSSWSHPVVVGGRLYLRYDTNLYCFDVKAGER